MRIGDMVAAAVVAPKGFCDAIRHGSVPHSFAVVHPPSSPSSSASVMEVWCGHENNSITVWNFSGHDHAHLWKNARPTQRSVSLHHNVYTSPSSAVTMMAASHDGRLVFCLVCDWMRAGAICIVDMATKTALHYLQCSHCGRHARWLYQQVCLPVYLSLSLPPSLPPLPVTCLSVTQNKLLLGTDEGEVQMYPLATLMEDGAAPLLPGSQLRRGCKQLLGHSGAIHTISLMNGCITPEGHTSLCQTYLGRQSKEMPCEFLLTVGNGCVDISSRGGEGEEGGGGEGTHNGCCLSVWLV